MREIQEKIQALTTAFEEQLVGYRTIQEMGTKERTLIIEGQLDALLELLEQKQSCLQQITKDEDELKKLQDTLVRHFNVSEFSIPKMRKAAPERYQNALASLENVISQLISVLETLEKQEQEHENLLKQYGIQMQKGLHYSQANQAVKAYSKKNQPFRKE